MSGFRAFFTKELHEIVRTWRIWVLPGMLLFFAAVSPVLALVTPRILASVAASQPGVVIQLPTPTAIDAYGQLLKNLTQIMLVALVIAHAGTISGERASGTATLVLTKPLSRSAFVLAKMVAQTLLLALFTCVSTALCAAVTTMLFPENHPGALVSAVALWLTFALVLIAVVTLLSAFLQSRGAAIGVGLGFYLLTLVLANWPAVSRYTFMGLLGAASKALVAQTPPLAWPLVTAAATVVLALAAAMAVFGSQEI